jgi:TrbL/VirB6 plasmid conjugal transfer protein
VRRALSFLVAGSVVLSIALVPTRALAQQTPPPAPSPSPATTVSPSPSPSESTGFEEPKKPPFWDVIGRVRYAISQWFSGLVTAALRPVFDLLGRTLFATPALASNGRISELWKFSLGVADATLLLFVLAGAGLVTAGSSLTSQITAKELLPRLLLAAGAANVSLLLLGHLIDISNALSRGMLGAGLDPGEVSGRMVAMLGGAALANPFLALLALAVVVLAVLVIIAYVVRIAGLVILATSAPLMLAGHALPQTEGAARMWWRATLAFLAAPVLQSMLLAATLRVFLSGDGVLGLPLGSGLIDLLVVGCLLYLLYKVPFWALNMAMSGAGSRAWGRAKGQARAAAAAATKAAGA